MTPGHRGPATGRPYLDAVLDPPGSVLALAHRGGARHPDLLGLENTLAAFRHAAALGYGYLETDVHATADGVLLAFHDDVLDRVTDRVGPLASLTAADVARARIGGREEVPTLGALLEELPQCRFNIDIKAVGAVQPLADLLEATGAHDRVCVGAFSLRRIEAFRRATQGRVATAAAPEEVAAYLQPSARLARLLTRGRPDVLQVPHRRGPLPLVTGGFVRRAHAAGLHVHVWTVDEPAEMEQLIDLGVDGIITDRTDVLKDVLSGRGLWREP